jgi:hypothetical protein
MDAVEMQEDLHYEQAVMDEQVARAKQLLQEAAEAFEAIGNTPHHTHQDACRSFALGLYELRDASFAPKFTEEKRELIEIFSDYHKAFYGYRPTRGYSDEEALIGSLAISREFDAMKATPEGRERLRRDGWLVEEPSHGQEDFDRIESELV